MTRGGECCQLQHLTPQVNLGVSAVKRFECPSSIAHRLVGLVVKASVSRAEDPGFDSRLRRGFSGSSRTSDLKIDTPGVSRYRVSAGTGRPGVSIL